MTFCDILRSIYAAFTDLHSILFVCNIVDHTWDLFVDKISNILSTSSRGSAYGAQEWPVHTVRRKHQYIVQEAQDLVSLSNIICQYFQENRKTPDIIVEDAWCL